MTDEQINIKIAELCGWKPQTICTDMQGTPWPSEPPNYAADLNACHEFEETLDYGQAELYDDELCDICAKTNELLDNPKPWRFAVTTATASQRCEAFLRVHGQWEE